MNYQKEMIEKNEEKKNFILYCEEILKKSET